MRIAVKRAGQPLEIVETNEKYRSDAVRKYIAEDESDTIQFIKMASNNTLSFGVNEDGHMLRLPLNFYMATQNPFQPIQMIVGTAVFVRTKHVNPFEEEIWDFEVEDLTDSDIDQIKREYMDEGVQTFYKTLYENLRVM